jgi:Ser/Thr protein kinase RdoA (MazF antagonist)
MGPTGYLVDAGDEPMEGWGEERASRAAERACELYSLEKPVLLRISHAAVYASGDHIVRVEQQGRPVWSGESLVALTRYVATQGVRTAAPVFELLPLIVDDLHVTFYRRVTEQTEMPEQEKSFLLGQQLAVLHDVAAIDHVKTLNMDDINLDFPSATIDRTLRSLEKVAEMGSKALSGDDVAELLDGVESMGAVAMAELEAHRTRGGVDGVTVIHGDSHLGNVLSVEDGIVLLDFEHTAVAEPFFDHLHVLLADRVFEHSNLYPQFVAGYGESFADSPMVEEWLKIVSVAYLTWTASVGEHSLPHREEAQRRMAWWRGGVGAPEFWTPGF